MVKADIELDQVTGREEEPADTSRAEAQLYEEIKEPGTETIVHTVAPATAPAAEYEDVMPAGKDARKTSLKKHQAATIAPATPAITTTTTTTIPQYEDVMPSTKVKEVLKSGDPYQLTQCPAYGVASTQ